MPTVLSKARENVTMKRLFVVLFALLASLVPVQMASATIGPDVSCPIPSYTDFSKAGSDTVIGHGVHYFYMDYMKKTNDSLPVASNYSQAIYNRGQGCTAYTNRNYFTDYSLTTVGKGANMSKVFNFKTNNSAVNIQQIQLQICDPTKCTQTFVKAIDGKFAQKASINFNEIPYKRVVAKNGKVSYQQYKLLSVQVYYLDANTLSNSYPTNPYSDMYQMPMG